MVRCGAVWCGAMRCDAVVCGVIGVSPTRGNGCKMRIGAGQPKALASCAGTHKIVWATKMAHALAAQGSSKLMGKSFRFHSPAGGGVMCAGVRV